MTEAVPDYIQPIIVRRAWRFHKLQQVIISINYATRWPVDGPLRAHCGGCTICCLGSPCPAEGCTCGIYGLKLDSPLPLGQFCHGDSILGLAAVWGRAFEAEFGLRSEFCRPLCFMQLDSRGLPNDDAIRAAQIYGLPLCHSSDEARQVAETAVALVST